MRGHPTRIAAIVAIAIALGVGPPIGAPAHAGRRATGTAALRARMPIRAQRLTGKRATCDGPNCLNAVEQWHGLTRKTAWTSWRTLDRKLKNPRVFRRLAPGEPERFGDVIVYRLGPRDDIFHGSIVLDETRVWEKASYDQRSPWRIASRRASAREYANLDVELYRRVDGGP